MERYRSGYNGPDSKSGVPATVPWVRIPPAPPLRNDLCMSDDRLGRVHLDSKGLSSFKPAIADAGLQGIAGLFFLKIAPYSTNPRLAARIDARRGVSSFQNRNRSCGLRFCFWAEYYIIQIIQIEKWNGYCMENSLLKYPLSN